MIRAGTVARGNDVAAARLLAAGLTEHHPDWRLTVLVAPGVRVTLPDDPGFDVLRASELADAALEGVRASAPPQALDGVLRPLLVRHLLATGDHVVLLPPDGEVHGPLDELVGALDGDSAVGVPRLSGRLPDDGERPGWRDLAAAGELDDQLVAVRSDERGHALVEWWLERARERALAALPAAAGQGGSGDALGAAPLDLAEKSLPGVRRLEHRGYAVGRWNLHERPLGGSVEVLTAGGAPVRLMRFDGFRPDRPWWLSAHGTRTRVLDDPLLLELCGRRARALMAAGWDGSIESVSAIGEELPNGLRFDARLRRLHAEGIDAGEHFGDLTTAQAADAFRAWLEARASEDAGAVSRYAYDVWIGRRDLQQAYPEPGGADAEEFAGWLWVHGRAELRLQPELLPASPDWVEEVERRPPAVRISGYLGGRLGLGQAARGYVTALRAANVSVGTRVLHPDARPGPDGAAPPVRAAEPAAASEPLPAGVAPDVELVCVNADQLAEALPDGEDPGAAPVLIGQWAWETDAIPERWDRAFALVDEVWVYSRYVAENIGRASPVPVIPVPLPVEPPPRVAAGAPLDLPADRFVFLYVFDHLSTVERKNPLGAIEAFRRAFELGEGPMLILKTINGHLRREAHERLRWAAGGRPDIAIVDVSLGGDELAALFARADCYVSLHRSEGFGLTLAESMILAKPVIATAYGGNTDFMTPLNSYLVDWTLRDVGPEAEHYPAEGHWAEPSAEHAAALMREIVRDPEERRRRGDRARADVTATLSPAAVGAIARDRLDRIVRSGGRDVPGHSVPALDALEHRLAFDLSGQGGRSGPRGVARRAILRALRPYTSAERSLDRAAADAMRRLWVELHAERAAHARDRARLARLERRLAQLERQPREPS